MVRRFSSGRSGALPVAGDHTASRRRTRSICRSIRLHSIVLLFLILAMLQQQPLQSSRWHAVVGSPARLRTSHGRKSRAPAHVLHGLRSRLVRRHQGCACLDDKAVHRTAWAGAGGRGAGGPDRSGEDPRRTPVLSTDGVGRCSGSVDLPLRNESSKPPRTGRRAGGNKCAARRITV